MMHPPDLSQILEVLAFSSLSWVVCKKFRLAKQRKKMVGNIAVVRPPPVYAWRACRRWEVCQCWCQTEEHSCHPPGPWNSCTIILRCLLQCAPHKLRPLNIIIASSTEIAAPWDFSCVRSLPLCWCWQFSTILKTKNFCLASFLARKKRCWQPEQASFFLRKKALQTK